MKLSQKSLLAAAVILLVLIADQTVKIMVKTNLTISESINLTGWFRITFVENDGIAMGINVLNKLFVSLFRIVACFAIAWYIIRLIKRNYNTGYIVCISLIFAGAVGNIIDSIFYGVLFSESTFDHTASLFPAEGAYSTWMHGRVVDMFDFSPIFPWVFNIADASISVGLCILLLFFRKTFSSSFEKPTVEA
jgi:signal peptidase II